MSNVTETSRRFVALAFKYNGAWRSTKTLPPEELQILFETVTAAGFQAAAVVPGELFGEFRDEDGFTGEKFSINPHCQFKVVLSAENPNSGHYGATSWLNQALSGVLNLSRVSLEERIERLRNEIEKSVPLTPIQLTVENDFLEESPPSHPTWGSSTPTHTRDGNELRSYAGIHETCCYHFELHKSSKTHNALVCQGCKLRIPIPISIRTFGDLRRLMAERLNQQS